MKYRKKGYRKSAFSPDDMEQIYRLRRRISVARDEIKRGYQVAVNELVLSKYLKELELLKNVEKI